MATRTPLAVPAALTGLLSAGVALGVGEAVAAFIRPAAAPIIAVGNRVVDLSPGPVKRWATETFGTSDKTVLLSGIAIVLALLSLAVGVLALRRLTAALGIVLAVGVLAAVAATTDRGSQGADWVPPVLGAVAAALVMRWLIGVLTRGASPARTDTTDRTGAAAATGTDRRTFVRGGLATAVVAAVAGFGGRALANSRADVSAARRAVTLPRPRVTEAGAAHPVGVDLGRSGVPWATPSAQFYRIDTALEVPQIAPKDWSLRVHGMVDREITLSYDQLLARPQLERWVTLCCVSNEVGGHLIGNARWQGALLADLLREAGLSPDCDQLVFRSPDGMSIGAPTAVVMDGREALIAVGMNGAPLPVEHGFPARIVVPGLYGYVSACKWVVDIEATTFAASRAFWIENGWAQQNSVKLGSRIDTPRGGGTLTAGSTVAIAGVAWDQHVGVSAVEVRIDDGPWQQARIAEVPSTDTWRQWVLPWTPGAGHHVLTVRAVDGSGQPQTEQHAAPYPSGATGLHSVAVTVRSAT